MILGVAPHMRDSLRFEILGDRCAEDPLLGPTWRMPSIIEAWLLRVREDDGSRESKLGQRRERRPLET
jgi:hypothetical protein